MSTWQVAWVGEQTLASERVTKTIHYDQTQPVRIVCVKDERAAKVKRTHRKRKVGAWNTEQRPVAVVELKGTLARQPGCLPDDRGAD